jgi:hypothetical protein
LKLIALVSRKGGGEMTMSEVSVGRVVRRGILVTAVLAMWLAPAAAQDTQSYSMAAGFIGTSFATSGDIESDNDGNASTALGVQLGYLWRGFVGGEFIADFSPTAKIANVLFADHPSLNGYMLNAIGSYPLGPDGRFAPYVSGGVGWIQLSTSVLAFPGISDTESVSGSQTRFGGDIGGGLNTFIGHVGVRTDVRYYKTSSIDNVESLQGKTAAEDVTQVVMSGLRFWRANVGVAFRW